MKTAKYLICAALALAACDNDGFYYQDQPRVRLQAEEMWSLGTDSLEFTFVSYGTDVTSHDINVDACIMGPVANKDRTARLAANPELTDAPASLYSYPETVVIPAGEAKASFKVTLKRDASLATRTVRLYLEVQPSEDFLTGTNETNHVLLKWSDKVTKPTNWESEIETYFGQYSDTKYRFMLSNAPAGTTFGANMSWAQMMNYKILFAGLLNEYNAAHPSAPLTDENGQLVSFNN